jgi:hypothetical protein
VSREKSIDMRLAAFRQETGTDPEAFVAGWRDGSIDRTPENQARAREAEALWDDVKELRPDEPLPNQPLGQTR